MVRDGKPHLVVVGTWYAVGESVGHLRASTASPKPRCGCTTAMPSLKPALCGRNPHRQRLPPALARRVRGRI